MLKTFFILKIILLSQYNVLVHRLLLLAKNKDSYSNIVSSFSVTHLDNLSEIQEQTLENFYDIILFDSKDFSENCQEIALLLAKNTKSGILFLSEKNSTKTISQLDLAGIYTICSPTELQIEKAITFLLANQKRLLQLQNENIKLQNKLEEMRYVDRAKCILIQYLNMTEQQAHRYIEKQSMDMRQSRLITAQKILKTYEL